MQSDDETSSLGVQSLASDGESTIGWETGTETEDIYDYEPGSFRMPAPETNCEGVVTAAEPRSLKDVQFPLGAGYTGDSIDFVVFAPLLVAREICSALVENRATKALVSAGYYDGNHVQYLDGEAPVVSKKRVALLYYSTVDSYDPLIEYMQYSYEVQEYYSCTPVANKYIEPVGAKADACFFSDHRCLLKVVSQDDSIRCMPVLASALPTIDLRTLVPVPRRNDPHLRHLVQLHIYKMPSFATGSGWAGFYALAIFVVCLFIGGITYQLHQESVLNTVAPICSSTTALVPTGQGLSSLPDAYHVLNSVADFSHLVIMQGFAAVNLVVSRVLEAMVAAAAQAEHAITTASQSTSEFAGNIYHKASKNAQSLFSKYKSGVSNRLSVISDGYRKYQSGWVEHTSKYYSHVSLNKFKFCVIKDNPSESVTAKS